VSYLQTWVTKSWVRTKSRWANRSPDRLGSHSNSAGRFPEFWKDMLWGGTPIAVAVLVGVVGGIVAVQEFDLRNHGPVTTVMPIPTPDATNYPTPHVQPSKKPIGQNPTCWLDRNPKWPDC
jgi:hypothetical protein